VKRAQRAPVLVHAPARPAEPDPAAAGRFSALRGGTYRRYFVAVLLAMTADNIEHVISYWVIFQTFHSPALAGFAVISHWVPFLLLSVYMGGLADRSDCRRLLHVSQALFMLVSAGWGLLFLTGTLRMWHAAALLLVHGIAGVVGASAIQLLLHDMVEAPRLSSAIRLNASSRYLSILLGPAVGGGLMLVAGPAWGLLANVLVYVPLSVLLLRLPYTGHTADPAAAASARRRPGLSEWIGLLGHDGVDRRIVTMVLLGGAASFLVGNAFQAQMPRYAHDLGADDTGLWYSVLLAANAAGAVLGAVLLETIAVLRPDVRTAIVCAGAWAATIGLFPAVPSYGAAATLLVLAGAFDITFTSMAQTLVQVLAPAAQRGRIVGLFNTSVLGLRAGSGVTVGLLGAVIDVHWSLTLSAAALVAVVIGLLAHERRLSRRAEVSVPA
jgi:MFS family permease